MKTNDEVAYSSPKLIYKSNEFVQKFKNTLVGNERKIADFLIASIKSPKFDKNFNSITIGVADLAKEIGYSTDKKNKLSGKAYRDIENALRRLESRQGEYFSFEDENGDVLRTYVKWIEKPVFNATRSTVTITLDKDMKPFLLNLNNGYFKYGYSCNKLMKSDYSKMIYELIKSWECIKNGIKVFQTDKLRDYLSCPASYKNFNTFKVNVLTVAMDEINEVTDLNVSYKEIKKGRKVDKIEFHFSKKKPEEMPYLAIEVPEVFNDIEDDIVKENVSDSYPYDEPIVEKPQVIDEDNVIDADFSESNDEFVEIEDQQQMINRLQAELDEKYNFGYIDEIKDDNESSTTWVDIVFKYDEFYKSSGLFQLPDIDENKAKYVFELAHDMILLKNPYELQDPNDERPINVVVGHFVLKKLLKMKTRKDIKKPYEYLLAMLEKEYNELLEKDD